MKRTFVSLILFLIVIGLVIFGIFQNKKNNEKEDLTKVTVAEVAHSIFYAPQYAAISKGYFEEEGIDVEGADGDEILEADEVFDIGDGRYLIVEG